MTVIEFKAKGKPIEVDPNHYFKDVFMNGLKVDCYNEQEVMITFNKHTFWWVANGEMILGSLGGLDFYLPISDKEIEIYGLTHITAASTVIRFCKKLL